MKNIVPCLKVIEDKLRDMTSQCYELLYENVWFAIFPTDAPIINTDLIDLFYLQNKASKSLCKINNNINQCFFGLRLLQSFG